MKIAITSTGNSLESKIDSRFGRCKYFVIYDDTTGSIEYFPNPNQETDSGAGPASVQLLASKNVSKIVSGEFGFKVKPLFDSLKIIMIVIKNEETTINDIIETLKN